MGIHRQSLRTMKENAHSPKEVAEMVKIHLRRQGTMKDAAKILGVAPTTLSTQLSGKSYLSQHVAARLANKYGFDITYLTTGIGSIIPTNEAQKDTQSFFIEKEKTDNGIEERVLYGIRIQIQKLDEIARTYNVMAEHIRDLARIITPESDNYDYCKSVIEELKDTHVKDIEDAVTTRARNYPIN